MFEFPQSIALSRIRTWNWSILGMLAVLYKSCRAKSDCRLLQLNVGNECPSDQISGWRQMLNAVSDRGGLKNVRICSRSGFRRGLSHRYGRENCTRLMPFMAVGIHRCFTINPNWKKKCFWKRSEILKPHKHATTTLHNALELHCLVSAILFEISFI